MYKCHYIQINNTIVQNRNKKVICKGRDFPAQWVGSIRTCYSLNLFVWHMNIKVALIILVFDSKLSSLDP